MIPQSQLGGYMIFAYLLGLGIGLFFGSIVWRKR